MTGKEALRQLVEYGWFARRADGVCYAVRAPSRKDLPVFVTLVAKLGQYAVPLHGGRAPIEVTSGSPETGPMFKAIT
jgi:hypothetical protein